MRNGIARLRPRGGAATARCTRAAPVCMHRHTAPKGFPAGRVRRWPQHMRLHSGGPTTPTHSAAPQPPPYWPRSQPPTQPAAHDAAGARGWASGRRSSASCSEMNTQNSFGTLTNASISCNERRTMRHVARRDTWRRTRHLAEDATRGSGRDTWRRTRHLAEDATRGSGRDTWRRTRRVGTWHGARAPRVKPTRPS